MGADRLFRATDTAIADRIIALRASGQDADANRVIAALIKNDSPGSVPNTVKELMRRSGAEANTVLSYAARRWWHRRWRLAKALREKDMADEAKRLRARTVGLLYRAAAILASGAFVVLLGGFVVVQCTPLGARSYVVTILSGDHPSACRPPACRDLRIRTYSLEPGRPVRTDYAITGDLHNLAAHLQLATPVDGPADRSFVDYTLSAGDQRATGEIKTGESKMISFDTAGAATLTLEMRVAAPVAGCNPTLTVTDLAMHRFAHPWLQRAPYLR